MHKFWSTVCVAVVGVTLLAGCGSKARPTASPTTASGSVRATQSPTPPSIPKSASHPGFSTPPSKPPSTVPAIHPGTAQTTEPTLAALHVMAAAFPTAQDGYISGTHTSGKHAVGFVQGTTDGGKTWQPLTLLPGVAFHNLTFQTKKRGWAVGEPVLRSNISIGPQQLFQTTNGGQTWTTVGTVSGIISSVVATPAGNAWISVTKACTPSTCPPGAVLEQVGHRLITAWNAPGPVLSLALHGSHMTAVVAVITAKSLTARLYTQSHGKTWVPSGSIGNMPWFQGGANGSPPASGRLLWTSAKNGVASFYSNATCAMQGLRIEPSELYR